MREAKPKHPLEQVLRRAKLSPYYRAKLAHVTRWVDVPLTTKEDLRAAYPFGLLGVPRERLATYHESSGTSGEPTSTYFTEEDWHDIASRFARNAVNLGPRDCVLVKTPYSLVTTAHQMHRAARLRGALVIPADNRSSNLPYSKVVRLLKDLDVTVAWCLPSEALTWARAARLAGFDPAKDFPKLRAFVVAGEAMSPARKARISAVWGGVLVTEDYGSTETGSLAGDCVSGRLHAWSDRLHFEVIDPKSGESRKHGEGQLAVTPLFREGQPLLRYLIGDHVRIDPGNCECGSEHPVIRVLGRPDSAIRLGAENILPVEVEDTVYRLPESHGVLFWRARPSDGQLAVEVEGRPEAAHALRELFREHHGLSVEVRAIAPGSILPEKLLTEPAPFLKPRFVFREGESWDHGLIY